MAKQTDETKEELKDKDTKKEKAESTKVKKIEFRTAKNKNFVGFVHPETRRFVTVDKDGKLLVNENDKKALTILRTAADLVEI